MIRTNVASTLLTVGAALNTWASPALAKARCEADLSRVQNEFCVGDQHLKKNGQTSSLSYEWQLKDQAFDLTTKVCVTDGSTVGDRKDLVLALDRSQGIWSVDSSHRKVDADNIATSRYIIEKLIAEAKSEPAAAPKVGLVMFSTVGNCTEYQSGTIVVNRDFPCLFVPALSVADEAHGERLLDFLDQADGKYSQGGPANSDFTVAGDLLASGKVGPSGPEKAGLILFSDGRSYRGEAGDPYAYLQVGNYTSAQDAAVSLYGSAALKKYRMVFALNPVQSPMYSLQNHGDAFSTMCEANGAPAADCNPSNVVLNNALTWPVNRLDFKAYATRLVESTGGTAAEVITVDAKQDIEAGLEALRVTAGQFASIDAVSYSVNGAEPTAGTVEGGRIGLPGLPAGEELAVELTLEAEGRKLTVPMSVKTTPIEDDGLEFSDAEMYCEAGVEPVVEEPELNLNNLQGGSASCGVTGNAGKAQSPWPLLLALTLPLGLAALLSFRKARAVVGTLILLAVLVPVARAEQAGGLNALQYSPVVDGVSMTEKATTINQGTYNFGLFMDYANDPVEIGGEKNERVNSIMDNLVTAHAVGNIGLLKNVSLGVHIPYVHNSDEERAVEGEDVDGGQVGQPADASVNFKINFVRKDAISFGFMPLATIPTGDSELLLGDGSANYGGLFLLSGLNGQFAWAFSTGYLHREKALELKDERTNSVKVTGQFLNYGGVEYRYSSLLSFGGNLQAKMTNGESIDFTRSNPAEWLATAKLRPSQGLNLEAGFGTGIGKGYGSPDYRVFGGLTYVPDASDRRYAAAPAAWKAKPKAQPAKRSTAQNAKAKTVSSSKRR